MFREDARESRSGKCKSGYAGDKSYEDSNGDVSAALWRTSDGGTTWKRFTAGNDYLLPFTDLAMNPDNHGEIWVTVGNFLEDKKVFRSSDSGSTWINITGKSSKCSNQLYCLR
jgi:photosystem II stability/assembly factor-like uncharacterized protein